MHDAKQIAERYIAAWNATDPKDRRERVAKAWTEDATYVDPLMAAKGRDGIAGLIEGVQARFPGFRFHLKGAPDGHNDHIRFSWALGPSHEDCPIEGTDIVQVTNDGQLASVIGFLDRVPAAA